MRDNRVSSDGPIACVGKRCLHHEAQGGRVPFEAMLELRRTLGERLKLWGHWNVPHQVNVRRSL
jgi:hypothetical protein